MAHHHLSTEQPPVANLLESLSEGWRSSRITAISENKRKHGTSDSCVR
jgi:hypothetical protein